MATLYEYDGISDQPQKIKSPAVPRAPEIPSAPGVQTSFHNAAGSYYNGAGDTPGKIVFNAENRAPLSIQATAPVANILPADAPERNPEYTGRDESVRGAGAMGPMGVLVHTDTNAVLNRAGAGLQADKNRAYSDPLSTAERATFEANRPARANPEDRADSRNWAGGPEGQIAHVSMQKENLRKGLPVNWHRMSDADREAARPTPTGSFVTVPGTWPGQESMRARPPLTLNPTASRPTTGPAPTQEISNINAPLGIYPIPTGAASQEELRKFNALRGR